MTEYFRPSVNDADVRVRAICMRCGRLVFEIVQAGDHCPDGWAGDFGIRHFGYDKKGKLPDVIEWRGSSPDNPTLMGEGGRGYCRIHKELPVGPGVVRTALRNALREGKVVTVRLP